MIRNFYNPKKAFVKAMQVLKITTSDAFKAQIKLYYVKRAARRLISFNIIGGFT